MYSGIAEIEADIQRKVNDFYTQYYQKPDTIVMSEPMVEYVDAWYRSKRWLLGKDNEPLPATSHILQYMQMDVVMIPGKDQELWFDLGTRNRR